jgi:hypothetical protein
LNRSDRAALGDDAKEMSFFHEKAILHDWKNRRLAGLGAVLKVVSSYNYVVEEG